MTRRKRPQARPAPTLVRIQSLVTKEEHAHLAAAPGGVSLAVRRLVAAAAGFPSGPVERRRGRPAGAAA